MVAEARARGVDVTCETCPHYLLFTEEDVERVGMRAQVRASRQDGSRSGRALGSARGREAPDGDVRSLTRGARGEGGDFFTAWGGISGCQSTLQLLLAAGHSDRGLPLEAVAAVTAASAAARFALPGKGTLAPGNEPISRSSISPSRERSSSTTFSTAIASAPTRACRSAAGSYERSCGAERVYADGAFATEPLGRFLTPGRKP